MTVKELRKELELLDDDKEIDIGIDYCIAPAQGVDCNEAGILIWG